MNTVTIRQILVVVTIFPTLLLTGCLAKDKPDAGFVGNGPPEQNSPPTISGNPQTAVMMGNSYSFRPTASDPDGDSLTFSVQNLPLWMSFDTSTGEIWGNPTLGDVGIFDQIQITVSDGAASASLSAFAIEVSQAALGSMTLSWTPPTENTDGTALTNLAGYRIYYGLSEGNYPNRVVIDTVGLSSYVVENLIPDTYYVVATSVNSMGVESAYSNVAIRTVSGS